KVPAAAPSAEEAALEARLLAAVERRKSPVAAEELLRAARPSTAENRPSGEERLAALEARGALVRTKGDRFTLPARLDLVAGRLHSSPAGFAFCVTDDPDEEDVYVPASGVRPAMHGDRVLVRVERFRRRGRAEGRVARVLEAHDLPREFPPEVAAAARRMPARVPPSATAGRLDLRSLPIVTIDGENARDFDDAVLVEARGTGFRLTVAVADVAHYVPAGSPLDLEARARGTSV